MNNNISRIIFVIIFTVISIFGCGRKEAIVTLTAEERYQRGLGYYEQNDFVRAINEFRIVVLQFSGSEVADDAQFYLAESYFNREEYILAANEYQVLINTMAGSPWVPEAYYKLALSYYHLSPPYFHDQEYTRKAIDELQTFIDLFPTHEKVPEAETKIHELTEKLAQKDYENARLYMRLGYYRAANVYFDMVMEKYHDTRYAERAHIGKVEALVERRQYEKAQDVVRQFIRQYPNSRHLGQAENLLRTITQELSKTQSVNSTQTTDIQHE